jgi:hypothetical protein
MVAGQKRERPSPADSAHGKTLWLAETLARIRVSNLSVFVNLLQALLAIILGNVVYFLLLPSLPLAARHHRFHVDLGMILDFWFCLVIYGAIRTARKWR